MAHCAHVLAPSCAWAASTEPKKRSRSVVSQLGNALRAMKPGSRRSTQEKVCVLNADALTEVENLQDFSMSKMSLNDDEISTQSGGSRSRASSFAESMEELASLPGSLEEIAMPSTSLRNSELDELAHVIADRAQSKFSGRVYQDVRNAFLSVDANGDGKLTAKEALAFCQHFDLSPKVTSRFFSLLDHHETGLANWSSFLATCAPVFNKKTDFKLNAGAGRKWPAIQ